jgi:biotin transport system substrate-specific component
LKKIKLSTKDICFIGLFAAVTAVMAQVSIPMPLGVPMTMQTFAVSLAGVMLGGKKGFVSILLYILLGAAGAPVFANSKGGLGVIAGPTGGFIVSFPIMAWIIGVGADRRHNGWWPLAAGLLLGTVFNFVSGMAVFSLATGKDLPTAFFACVAPFIPTAIIKASAAGALGAKIRRRIVSLA